MNKEQQDNQVDQMTEKSPHEQESMDQMPEPEQPAESHAALGPIIGVLIVVLVVILAGLYFWGVMLIRNNIEPAQFPAPEERVNNEPETPRTDADVQINNTVSSSDELSAIEADLESTQLENLDQELDSILSELEI